MLNTPEEIFYSVIVGVGLMVFLAGIFVISIVRYQRKANQHRLEKQDLQTQFKQTLLQSQLEIQEQTLQHIAHELHDNLGQVASLIKIHLNTIVLGNNKTEEKIEDTKILIKQLITDLKHLSLSLNGNRIIQLGLLNGLQKEVERINKLDHINAKLTHDGDISDLNDQTVIIIFRMCQEIINNVIKHSNANQLAISLTVHENLLTLEFIDNGSGFDVDSAINNGGSGLINLQNRAKMINAKLSISSSQKGTQAKVDLPLAYERKETYQTGTG